MNIDRFDSALPPPDKGKGQKQDSRIGKRKRTGRIELFSYYKSEPSCTNRISRPMESGNTGSRIGHPASRISRFRLKTYNKIICKDESADPQSYHRADQPALDRTESSPDTESVRTVSTDGSADKLTIVRLKIVSGYYDNPEHLEKLADRLMDRLNIGNLKGPDDAPRNRE